MKSFREYLIETADEPLVNRGRVAETAAPQHDEVSFRPPLNAEEKSVPSVLSKHGWKKSYAVKNKTPYHHEKYPGHHIENHRSRPRNWAHFNGSEHMGSGYGADELHAHLSKMNESSKYHCYNDATGKTHCGKSNAELVISGVKDFKNRLASEKCSQCDKKTKDIHEEVKVGDHVHLGFGAKGGAGFYGHVTHVGDGKVKIKHESGKEYVGPLKNVSSGKVNEAQSFHNIQRHPTNRHEYIGTNSKGEKYHVVKTGTGGWEAYHHTKKVGYGPSDFKEPSLEHMSKRLSTQTEENEVEVDHYQVWRRASMGHPEMMMGKAKSIKRARNMVDKHDNEYGGYAHHIKPVYKKKVQETSNEPPNIQRLMLTQELMEGDTVRLKSNKNIIGHVAKIDETMVYFNTENGSTLVSHIANLIKEDSFVPKHGELLKEKEVEEEITAFKEPENSRGSYDDFEHHRKMHVYHNKMTDWHLAHSVTMRHSSPEKAQHHKEMARIHDNLANQHHRKLYEEKTDDETESDKTAEKKVKTGSGDVVLINPRMKADISQGLTTTPGAKGTSSTGTGGEGLGANRGTQG